MFIEHLSLANFRNYVSLEFDVPERISVFQGANAQGKTTLFEAICYLATTKLSRVIAERDLINWDAMSADLPYARLSTKVQKAEFETQIEITLQNRSISENENGLNKAPLNKQIRINKVPYRVIDLVGQLNVVLFTSRDIDLVGGEPSLRRRHLDILNSQMDRQYLRALQRYNKVISQRNHLLRQIASHRADTDELTFWDKELVEAGAYIVFRRQQTIARLNELAGPIHEQLTGNEENLTIQYLPSIDVDNTVFNDSNEVADCHYQILNNGREKELHRGLSLFGPHRDDMKFWANGVNVGIFGSRGQQRTTALSLKLAEAKLLLLETDESPVVLLDDVLSELDSARRHHLLEQVQKYQQVLITATDLDRFPSGFLAGVEKFNVELGTINPQ